MPTKDLKFMLHSYIVPMIPERFQKFYAKVMLFGEYSVIRGHEALALPIHNFSGQLKLLESPHEENIAPFIQYLGALHHFDIEQDLLERLELNQLIFESNIPIGYGAGSSGALTAAVYSAFIKKRKTDVQELKDDLASIEDYFHGSSSGLDPLVSYLCQAVHISERRFQTFEIDQKLKETMGHFYLLDTGISRSTGPLVEIFKKKIENQIFESVVNKRLASYNRDAIDSLLSSDHHKITTAINKISALQYEHFQEMIPKDYLKLWQDTLDDKELAIKLCGAGGGGFLLVYSLNSSIVESWSKLHNLDLLKIKL